MHRAIDPFRDDGRRSGPHQHRAAFSIVKTTELSRRGRNLVTAAMAVCRHERDRPVRQGRRGVLDEYIWRGFDESRGRPRYIIESPTDEVISGERTPIGVERISTSPITEAVGFKGSLAAR
ncbi:MAG: hypothetical protein HY246_16485 [Proteobacteria bacterium]|nr:hypothetical protein [Pseudomonadota bacterium]